MKRYRLRHVALHIAYLGGAYSGLSAQEGPSSLADGGSMLPGKAKKSSAKAPVTLASSVPAVETALFAALQQACLIETRAGCGYTRCGRTDRGVSAAGQIVALRLRSKAKRFEASPPPASGPAAASSDGGSSSSSSAGADAGAGAAAGGPADSEHPRAATRTPSMWTRLDPVSGEPVHNGDAPGAGEPFPPPEEEVDYAQTLNSLLPKDIRVLGWADVPGTFSARFSCTGRVYRYYFPGRGLDLGAMRRAAALLQGNHDFRNVARIDIANTQNFVRALSSLRIVRVDEADPAARMAAGSADGGAGAGRPLVLESYTVPPALAPEVGPYKPVGAASPSGDGGLPHPETPSRIVDLLGARNAEVAACDATGHLPPAPCGAGGLYYLQVTGNAFLWHQVRCLVALLFHVGRGFETPDTVAWLLDVTACPARPQYPMAPDAPLVLYHCAFGEEGPEAHYRDKAFGVAPTAADDAEGGMQVDEEEEEGEGVGDDEDQDGGGGGAGPSPRVSLLDSSLYRPTRFSRSLPGLHASMYHSPAALRRLTGELEGHWSGLAVQAAMVRGLLDRVYALHVREGEAAQAAGVTGAKSAAGASGAAGGGAGAAGKAISWGEAVARYSASASRHDATVTRPLVALEDCEMSIHGLPALAPPPAAGAPDSDAQGRPAAAVAAAAAGGAGSGNPYAGVPRQGRGTYVPFWSRPKGFSVAEKWHSMTDSKRAAITAMHPVNAAKLAVQLSVTNAAADS